MDSITVKLCLTVLAILQAGESLQPCAIQGSKGLADVGRHPGDVYTKNNEMRAREAAVGV